MTTIITYRLGDLTGEVNRFEHEETEQPEIPKEGDVIPIYDGGVQGSFIVDGFTEITDPRYPEERRFTLAVRRLPSPTV
jgi:hypothetical protein